MANESLSSSLPAGHNTGAAVDAQVGNLIDRGEGEQRTNIDQECKQSNTSNNKDVTTSTISGSSVEDIESTAALSGEDAPRLAEGTYAVGGSSDGVVSDEDATRCLDTNGYKDGNSNATLTRLENTESSDNGFRDEEADSTIDPMNLSPGDGISPPTDGEPDSLNTSCAGEDRTTHTDMIADNDNSDPHSDNISYLAGNVDTSNGDTDASGSAATRDAPRARTAKKSMLPTSHSSMVAEGLSSEMLVSPRRKRRDSDKSAHREINNRRQVGAYSSASTSCSSAGASQDEEDNGENQACRPSDDDTASTSCRTGNGKVSVNRQEDQYEVSVPFAQAQPVPSYHGALRVYPMRVNSPSPGAGTLEFITGGGVEEDDEGLIIHHRQDSEDVEVAASSPASVSALIEARLVSEPALVEALPVEQAHSQSFSSEDKLLELVRRQSRKRRRLWIAIIVLVTIIVVLVLGISLGTTLIVGDKAPAKADESFLRGILPNYTIEALENPGSAQYLALRWVLDDEYIRTNVDSEDRPRRLIQRYALAILFYAASGGVQWRPHDGNWLVRNSNECEWHGCTCSVENRLQQISVRGVPLSPSGYIPPEIALLSDLVTLDGGNTSIQGTLPTQIGVLTLLAEFFSDHTSISGTIPTEFGYLRSLSTLSLEATGIRGTIPTDFAALTRLSKLRLDHTDLTGTIPTEIGLLTNLTTLSLKSTSLGGTLPTELGFLSNLEYLELQETWIGGESVHVGVHVRSTFIDDAYADENDNYWALGSDDNDGVSEPPAR